VQLRPSGFSRASKFKFFQDFSVKLNDVNATDHSTLGMQFNDNTKEQSLEFDRRYLDSIPGQFT